VILRQLLVQDHEVRSVLLYLQQDIGHRGRFSHHEEPALLEEESGEAALKRPTVSDDRRPARWIPSHASSPTRP